MFFMVQQIVYDNLFTHLTMIHNQCASTKHPNAFMTYVVVFAWWPMAIDYLHIVL